MAESPGTFAGLLRELRRAAHLTQDEIAQAAGVSLRSVSDLERGVVSTPQRETVRLLADALYLTGPERARFEAAARGRPVDSGAAALRTLPHDIASFSGRQRELRELVDAAAETGGVVGIHAIGGMAGVGKTAFAVHAAHRLAGRFPGGQIFLPLHGHTPGHRPVDPDDALASLLLTIGVPAAQIPAGAEARAALWRDRVAARPLLLVLDDAASSGQVLPLLPGSGASLVLVTSRRHLSALEAAVISLDVLPPDEAAGMLVRLAGRPALSPADPGVRELTRLCGFLPLAIGMVGRQLRHHAAWSAAGQAAELAAARDRLELMATENVSVAAAFDLSHDDLAPGQRLLFRRLGLHPGTDIDRYAAAALAGIDAGAARRGLEALYDQYLLTEPDPGRYRMHDLIREHARTLAAGNDPGEERDQAVGRLLDYYQHTAARANALIARQTRTVPGGAAPAAAPALDGQGPALAWARGERANLLACLDHASRTGQHARVVALTAGLSGLLQSDGPWADAIGRHTAAIDAARRLGDRPGQADALNDRGDVLRLTGDYPAAARDLTEALAACRDLGDRSGQARALTGLGSVRRLTGDSPAAARDLTEALAACRDLGDRLGQASALHQLGIVGENTGDHPAAIRNQEEALALYRDLGDRSGQASALTHLGAVRRQTGDYPAAVRDFTAALASHREVGNRLGAATTLVSLGSVRQVTGDFPAATRDFTEALGLHREIGSRLGEATALWRLGSVRLLTGDHAAAVRDFTEALGRYREIGSRLGEANALTQLGMVRQETGDHPAAIRDLAAALGINREIGNRVGEANARYYLGAARRLTGDYPAAVGDIEEALALYRDLGDRGGEVTALNERGTLYRLSGELARAERYHQQALELARAIAGQWDEAHALAGLSRCARAAGDQDRAASQLREALEIFRRIGAAETAEIEAELASSAR